MGLNCRFPYQTLYVSGNFTRIPNTDVQLARIASFDLNNIGTTNGFQQIIDSNGNVGTDNQTNTILDVYPRVYFGGNFNNTSSGNIPMNYLGYYLYIYVSPEVILYIQSENEPPRQFLDTQTGIISSSYTLTNRFKSVILINCEEETILPSRYWLIMYRSFFPNAQVTEILQTIFNGNITYLNDMNITTGGSFNISDNGGSSIVSNGLDSLTISANNYSNSTLNLNAWSSIDLSVQEGEISLGSTLNLNNNKIDNVNTITGIDGITMNGGLFNFTSDSSIDIFASGGYLSLYDYNQNFHILGNGEGAGSITSSGNLKLTSGKDLTLGSSNQINVNSGVNFVVNASDSIILNAPNDINLNSTSGNVNINSILNMNDNDIAAVNNITATTFTGALSGNATSASSATTATNVTISDNNTNSPFYPVFVTTNTGNLPLYVDKNSNPFTYNPSTGNLTSTTFTGGLALPTTNTTATFATNTLTITGSTTSTFKNFSIGFTGITNTITTLSLSSFPVNAEYYVTIYNGGTGILTINATGLGAGIKTTFASAVIVPVSGYALMKINYLAYTTGGNIYVVSINLVA